MQILKYSAKYNKYNAKYNKYSRKFKNTVQKK